MNGDVFGVIAPHPPIMVPEVGGRRAGVTAASAEALATAARLLESWDPDTIVIMSPHAPGAADAFVVETSPTLAGDLGQFGASQVALRVSGDPEFAHALIEACDEAGIPAIDRAEFPSLESGHLDHGVLVPMSFLDRAGRWPLLVVSLSWLPYEAHRAFGGAIARVAQGLGRRIAFVASGDCSHRLTPDAPAGYDPVATSFDRRLVELIGDSDFDGLSHLDPDLVEKAGECGLRSFITLGAVAAPASGRVLSYEGPWGVGYLTGLVNEQLVGDATPASGSKGGAAGEPESEIVALARETITSYLSSRSVPQTPVLSDPSLPARAGVFVSLHRQHELRGCIGTIGPTEATLALEVVRNAVQAATQDPRFPSMTADELADLDISVDVLYPAEECTLEDLDPKRYGVIVTSGWRRGLLLPDLEGVDTVAYQLEIARRKAGIDPDEPVKLERFRVDRYV